MPLLGETVTRGQLLNTRRRYLVNGLRCEWRWLCDCNLSWHHHPFLIRGKSRCLLIVDVGKCINNFCELTDEPSCLWVAECCHHSLDHESLSIVITRSWVTECCHHRSMSHWVLPSAAHELRSVAITPQPRLVTKGNRMLDMRLPLKLLCQ